MSNAMVQYRDRGRAAYMARLRSLDGKRIAVGFLGPSAAELHPGNVGPSGHSGRMPAELIQAFDEYARQLRQGSTEKKRKSQPGRRSRGRSRMARLVDIATWQHYGTRTIPSRKFMGFLGQEEKFKKLMREAARAVLKGMDRQAALDRIGLAVSSIIRRRIIDLRTPELSWVTKRARFLRRGETNPNPLVDTGRLSNSVTWEVR